jgi:hypothetical protein
MPERTGPPEASGAPEPISLPERRPTRRRLLVSTWLFVIVLVIEVPRSIWSLTEGAWLAGIGGLLIAAGLVGLLVHNLHALRQTPA